VLGRMKLIVVVRMSLMLAILAGVALLTGCFGVFCCPPCPLPVPVRSGMYVANTSDTVTTAFMAGTGGGSLGNLGGTLDSPHGIALDLAAGKMYVTNYNSNTVTVANLDGTGGTALAVATLNLPSGIALDVTAGKMYVTDSGNHRVTVANLDGTGGARPSPSQRSATPMPLRWM
jgi:DNA-binding beta-propeller fold protein YncE